MTTETPHSPHHDHPPKGFGQRLRRLLVGRPRDVSEAGLFHRLTLIPILAWIGLGADGLSSSAYGPEEAFRALGSHTYLAFGLALATALTVFIIAVSYSRIIEEFPGGGGGYLVASRLLGPRLGVVSGCALLVDYALTIAVSLAAAGDALFSLAPVEWHVFKLPVVLILILGLMILNIRGVRESVLILAPVFFLFVVTHAVLIGTGVVAHLDQLPAVVDTNVQRFQDSVGVLGYGGLFVIFARAFAMGGGTYTGLEAVSNGMPIMREPRVRTAKRTMMYMAVSLAITAGGLIWCYMLFDISHEPGKTLNAVLAQSVSDYLPFGHAFVVAALFAAGALLVVAAQAGFLDGPRVMATMAVDSWVPRGLAALSDRLTTQNGIVAMGLAALAMVLYTRGNTHNLVVMYSINVFLTFSLSMFGMLLLWIKRKGQKHRVRRMSLFGVGFLVCFSVLIVTVIEKFTHGGWLTVVVTGLLVTLCFAIRSHYRAVYSKLTGLDKDFVDLHVDGVSLPTTPLRKEDPTAVVLVAGYGGLGIHTLLNVFRFFPDQFKNVVFVSVGVIDSAELKGSEQIDSIKDHLDEALQKYVKLAAYLDYPATYRLAMGTEVVDEAVELCATVAEEYPKATFFAGQLVFEEESWFHRFLHNQTAFSIQRRLLWQGRTMVVLPVRVG